MKKFVSIEFGSRGEVESIELVEKGVEVLEKEFKEFVERFKEDCEDIEEFESYEEFFGFDYFKNRSYISEGRGEEWYFIYVDFDKYEDLCNELLEIDKKVENDEIEYWEYVNRVNEIIDIVMGYSN